MPTSTPYAAQEIAMVSSTPAGNGLPIGLMPGALPSDQASRQTLNTTAMRLPFGQTQSGCRFMRGSAGKFSARHAGAAPEQSLNHIPDRRVEAATVPAMRRADAGS